MVKYLPIHYPLEFRYVQDRNQSFLLTLSDGKMWKIGDAPVFLDYPNNELGAVNFQKRYAMAASAVVELSGGTPQQCLDAGSTVLMNLLGLVVRSRRWAGGMPLPGS